MCIRVVIIRTTGDCIGTGTRAREHRAQEEAVIHGFRELEGGHCSGMTCPRVALTCLYRCRPAFGVRATSKYLDFVFVGAVNMLLFFAAT